MTIALRNTVRNAREFTRWAAKAEAGSPVTYHIGSLAADRADSPALHLLDETVLIFAQCGYVATSQHVMRLPIGTSTWYVATRTGRGRVPTGIMFDRCDAHTFRALEALRQRDASQSAARAIRDHMGCPESLALDFLCLLWARGWIQKAEPKGYELSPEGLKMLNAMTA
jgi:hypothetical protein